MPYHPRIGWESFGRLMNQLLSSHPRETEELHNSECIDRHPKCSTQPSADGIVIEAHDCSLCRRYFMSDRHAKSDRSFI